MVSLSQKNYNSLDNPCHDTAEELEIRYIKAQSYFLIHSMVTPPNVKRAFENLVINLRKEKREKQKLWLKKQIVKLHEERLSS